MASGKLITLLLTFLAQANAYLDYKSNGQLTCHPTSQVGIVEKCCTDSTPNAWGQFCNGDLAGPTGCLPNELWSAPLDSSSAPFDTGPVCYKPGGCSLQSWKYNYHCCPCPSGYQVYSLYDKPNCDGSALCVGCTDPKEKLVGSSAAGWSCSAAPQPPCPSGTKSNACTASGTSCSFYTCLEGNHKCGASGYPTSYGLNYCQKFAAVAPKLSAAGQTWIKAVTLCLQKALAADVQCKATCDQIKDDAFASHAGCYVNNGLCSLPVSDWTKIVGVVSFEDLFGSRAALEQILQTASGCGTLYADVFSHMF